MAEVEIYTTMFCPFCVRAKKLLDSKNVTYTEIDVTMSSSKRAAMEERADGRYTVPQIFIDGVGIGGSDDLAALEASGKLDEMLAAQAS
ncbi:MAG: glutaredoxin 3 [Nisaea sp.]|jgi:glutaredoxin 3|uniref:glutaredoxin 3 n=1 Tax=Nisaea sp. TaxID=2024842 RepID=UPI001B14202D|nr:glutaredoxin 3 [Nisaea sp.]MBO6560371.1 glutaredoxin 3 [Nisaea sp.]